MYKEIQLTLSPQEAAQMTADITFAQRRLSKEADVESSSISHIRMLKRSIDARRAHGVLVLLTYGVWVDEQPEHPVIDLPGYKDVSAAKPVVVVGAGPGGLFAALRLVELGLRPIVVERGQDVSKRKVDIAQLCRTHNVNPESNYAFGEGGAGTFSDGKLYTRSTKRGNINKILQVFCHHGAKEDILIDAHPHIGTDVLPTVIKNMRETIIAHGGQVLFGAKMTDIKVVDGRVRGIVVNDKDNIDADAVILATGHSARDVYYLLHSKGISLEAKTWAMGVRVEHPQELIDQIQYHSKEGRGDYLPAASYSFVTQVADRGVYSFCMCPGGFIVPAMTAGDQQVVNGMSPSHRGSPFANSGMVVEIRPEDIGELQNEGPLGSLKYQEQLEQMAYINGGRGITAPAQGLADFVQGKISQQLPPCSYVPGVMTSPLHFWLPEHIGMRLRKGFETFGKQARGFMTNEACVVGVESRTSSPVRIPRNPATMQHPSVEGLFPCGEGAGYAGGIVSSAVDGELCAEKIAELFKES
ncbi:MAG: FAD-binding protein [Bacteroidales bacterium]|nr:FAD-binding protein [Bacteroidales bacterium]